MKIARALLLSIMFAPLALAQSPTPTPVAAYINAGSGWNPWASAAAFGAIGATPVSVALFCQASATAQWTPCTTGATGTASITGGTINGAVIGGTTPAAGSFTILYTPEILTPCTVGFAGVFANELVQFGSGSNNCFASASGAANSIGVAQSTVASGGTVQVAQFGYVASGCIADNTWTTGDLLGDGTTTAGTCKDLGTPISGNIPASIQIVGRAQTACTAGNSCPINTVGVGHFGTLLTYSATTPSIGGSLLSIGCANQSAVTVTGAATAMACVMTGVAGNPANIEPQCSVSAANTVIPQLCTAVAVTPTAQTYNIRVIP